MPNATVNARVINVEGRVEGDLHGEEQVVLKRSANVQGNITAPRVTLEDGAKFKGSIDMDPGVDMPVQKEPTKRAATAASANAKAEPVEEKRAQSGG